jgi:ferredoxin, 2Fe-2S
MGANFTEQMNTIHFTFEESHLEARTVQGAKGDNLLEVALKNDIALHHNCGGVCACSTCHVYVLEGEDYIPEITDKEEDFVDRAINPRLNSRLSCQCELLEDGQTLRVLIPDQSRMIGH